MNTIGLDNANKSTVQWIHLRTTVFMEWRQILPM